MFNLNFYQMEIKKAGENKPQNEKQLKTPETAKNVKSIEELQKENQELATKLAELEKIRVLKPAKIDDIIKFYEDKKKAIDLLEVFKFKKNELTTLHAEVKEQIKNEDFEDAKFTLLLGRGNGRYNENGTININNPVIIDKAIEFIQNAINIKIETLEKQIQA